jgi:hypothetical protein
MADRALPVGGNSVRLAARGQRHQRAGPDRGAPNQSSSFTGAVLPSV